MIIIMNLESSSVFNHSQPIAKRVSHVSQPLSTHPWISLKQIPGTILSPPSPQILLASISKE